MFFYFLIGTFCKSKIVKNGTTGRDRSISKNENSLVDDYFTYYCDRYDAAVITLYLLFIANEERKTFMKFQKNLEKKYHG